MAGATLPEQETPLVPTAFAGRDAKKLWRTSAPAGVRKQWSAGDHAEAWEIYRLSLVEQTDRETLKSKLAALGWGSPPATSEFVASLEKAAKRGKLPDLDGAASDWLDALPSDPPLDSLPAALDAVAWANVLCVSPESVPTELWVRLLDSLVNLALAASQSRASLEGASPERVVAHNLFAGELPLTLATGLDALKPVRELRDDASATLSEALIELTDGEGMATASVLSRLPALLACWTRCRTMSVDADGDVAERGPWSADAQTQYEWLVRQSLRMTKYDGSLLLSRCGSVTEALAEALSVDGDSADDAAAERRLPLDLDAANASPPDPSTESEWAETAVLSAGWAPKSPVITVTWDRPTMRLALVSGKQTLLEGDWPVVVRRNGQRIDERADGPLEWDSQCWYSDQDCDYLELATDLADGVRLERQVILGRQHGVVGVAEIVTNGVRTGLADEASWEIETRLELAPGVRLEPEPETHDAVLHTNKGPAAALLPCSLPEWRVERDEGALTRDQDHRLRMLTIGQGRNLASLLWIDLSAKRFAKQRTWRRLSVAQSLKKVARDVAVSFRMQSGKDQWLYYRSLDPPANRTVLGQNLSSEAFVGRFLPTGEVDEYFEIEADA
ncbi:MAG: hypothetical protein AAFV43_14350 [Planctomycetota bacterium]